MSCSKTEPDITASSISSSYQAQSVCCWVLIQPTSITFVFLHLCLWLNCLINCKLWDNSFSYLSSYNSLKMVVCPCDKVKGSTKTWILLCLYINFPYAKYETILLVICQITPDWLKTVTCTCSKVVLNAKLHLTKTWRLLSYLHINYPSSSTPSQHTPMLTKLLQYFKLNYFISPPNL